MGASCNKIRATATRCRCPADSSPSLVASGSACRPLDLNLHWLPMTTRRDFVQHSVAAGALLGLQPGDGDAGSPQAIDYYDKLGVSKIINAAGTYTYLTASLMPPEVQAAVALAANHSVRLRDLQTAAGAYLASRLRSISSTLDYYNF